MRKLVAPILALCVGFALCHATRPTPHKFPNWPDVPPESVTVSRPVPGGRESHSLRVTRLGTSHESGNLPVDAWRVVFVTGRGTWFAECEHVSTVTAGR